MANARQRRSRHRHRTEAIRYLAWSRIGGPSANARTFHRYMRDHNSAWPVQSPIRLWERYVGFPLPRGGVRMFRLKLLELSPTRTLYRNPENGVAFIEDEDTGLFATVHPQPGDPSSPSRDRSAFVQFWWNQWADTGVTLPVRSDLVLVAMYCRCLQCSAL